VIEWTRILGLWVFVMRMAEAMIDEYVDSLDEETLDTLMRWLNDG
jgi:hypothetical protein